MVQPIAILREIVNCAAVAAIALGAGSCGPIVERAPFPARPDTLRPGDLLGPFDGIVVDADTERPIAGAVVSASWAFERGVGMVGPLGAREVTSETTADGRYHIPALKEFPVGASSRIRRFTLVVYHRGHIAWRSDRRFPRGEPRRDFSQRGNRVRLDRWQESFRHVRHLAFLGGGASVRAAAAWEVQPASLELEGGGRAGGPQSGVVAATAEARVRLLDVAPLLSVDEVRGVTGYAGKFEVGTLTDLPATEFYASRHWKALGKTESHDVGLRLWRMGTAGAEAAYRKLLAELPGAAAMDEIGDASLRARAGEIAGLAFLQRERGIVVSVTCGVALCTEPSMILRLAKLAESHLGDLAPAPPPPEAPR